MPLIEKIFNWFQFAIEALDGIHGWKDELIAIVLFVFLFNFVIKWGLRRLHLRFSQQQKIWHDSFVVALHKPLSCFIWLFAGVQSLDLISYRVFDSTTWMDNKHLGLEIALILSTAWFFLRWKSNIVGSMIVKSKNHQIAFDQGRIDVVDKALTVIICFVTGLLLLEATDRSMNTLITVGGVGGLAIAFSAQEMIASFFGGLMIYLTHPFGIGDWVSLPEKNAEGHVEEIGWYMTRIRTFEKRPIYIPNSNFGKMIVVNPSRMTHRQIKETIGLRYSDLPALRDILSDLKGMLVRHPDVDNTQTTIVRLTSFGVYSLNLLVSTYVKVVDGEGFNRAKEDILFKIIEIVHKHNADFAFPTSTIEMNPSSSNLLVPPANFESASLG
jgi:MscS family membrane protein